MADRADVFVVTHTHWDREWYLPAGRFRQRLVELIDALLDNPPAGSVLLDGQGVVLDDYLAVRPERRELLAERLRHGALEAGPWYVLADELIPSGESLARNLLAGRRTLRSLGAEPPRVLYSPDAFGHPAALPTLAAGFGLPLIILWRGFGGESWPDGDGFRWRAGDGSEVALHHLPRSGYEHASSLSGDAAELAAWWTRARGELMPRSRTGTLLLLNGADHHAPQRDLESVMTLLSRVVAPDRLHRSTLDGFAERWLERARDVELPLVEGELRDSYGYSWTLQGTLSARAHQKRRAASVERLLLREAEPWSALAWRAGSHDRAALVDAAWRTLLLCHPHDTLCGCSSDDVARAMDARLEDAEAQARGIVEDALLALAGHDRGVARVRESEWKNSVLIRNPVPRARSGVVEIEIATFGGRVPVGPGSAGPHTVSRPPGTLGFLDGKIPVQLLETSVRHDRIESPEHYPRDDFVHAHRVVAWVETMPEYGVVVLPVAEGPRAVLPRQSVRVDGKTMDNGLLRVEIDDAGVICLTSPADGRVLRALVGFEDIGDAGDLYTHSPIGPVIETHTATTVQTVHPGPLRGGLRGRWRLDVPRLTTREGRSAERAPIDIDVTLTLDAGGPFLRLDIEGSSAATDHRLRIVLHTDVVDGVTHADAAFGVVRRDPIVVSDVARAMETPPRTAPLHRYVTLSNEERGATLISDGLAEYEVSAAGRIAVTLLRAVGELSRNDLPERPGHAGWPVATPEAQSPGRFAARLALHPHAARTDQVIDAIERVAEDVLLPMTGVPLRWALTVAPDGAPNLTLEGVGLAFAACKVSEDREWLVLRCVNLLEVPVRGRWRLGRAVTEARRARLDETPLGPIGVAGDAIEIEAGARAVVTVLTR